MAIRQLTGLETGDSSELRSTSGTFSIQTSITRGTWSIYALRTNPTTSGIGSVQLSLPSTAGATSGGIVSILFARFYFRIATAPASASEPIGGFGSSGSSLRLEVRLTSTGVLSFYDAYKDGAGGAPTLLATGTTVLSSGTWYRIEMKADLSDGLNNVWECKIDGTSEANGSVVNTDGQISDLVLGKATNRNSQSVDFYYDDIILSDSGYVGSGQCGILIPSANGNYQFFTIGAGSGSHFQIVDEIPHNSDTDYLVSDLNTAHAETEAMQNSSVLSISGTINCAKPCIIVKRDGASNGSIKLRHRSSTTDTDLSAFTTTASYVLLAKLLDTNPATGTAWTTSGIDGVEVGALEASATQKSRMTACYLMVDWTPSGGGGTTYNITPSGSVTVSGSLTLTVSKSLAGSITEIGSLTKSIQKPLAGSLTPSGIMLRGYPRSLGGSLSPSGILSKTINKSVAGSSTPNGTLSPTITKSLSGSITVIGSITKSTSHILSGNITSSGILTSTINKSISGNITPLGTLTKSNLRALSGNITINGTLVSNLTKHLSGSISLSGTLDKSIFHILVGNITPNGTLTFTINKSLDGSISLSGEVSQPRLLNLSGVITSSGELTRQVTKGLQGSISPIGVVTRSITKILNGEIILGGVLDVLFVSAPDIIIGIITVSPLTTGQISCSPVMEGNLTTLPSITGVVKFNPELP